MAIRSEAIRTTAVIAPPLSKAAQLAALPCGSVVAIFDTRVDAANAALQASVHDADAVWLARGSTAAEAIRAARIQRGLASRALAGMGDEEPFVAARAQAGRCRSLAGRCQGRAGGGHGALPRRPRGRQFRALDRQGARLGARSCHRLDDAPLPGAARKRPPRAASSVFGRKHVGRKRPLPRRHVCCK